jgi:arylsulfatase A-like enzyme
MAKGAIPVLTLAALLFASPAALGSLPSFQFAAVAGPARQNVLMIVSDDLNWVLGCYGHPIVKTPNLDALSRQGVRFQRAYCQVSFCNPSRASFLTGLRPSRTGVLDNTKIFRAVHPEILTLPQHFKENGYWTGRVGKLFHEGNEDVQSWLWRPHLPFDRLPEQHPLRKASPLNHWAIQNTIDELHTQGEGRNVTGGRLPWAQWRAVESGDLVDERIANAAVKQIRTLSSAQPFFLGVGFIRPHDPFFAPKRFFDLYPPESIRLPASTGSGIPPTAYGIKQWGDVYETLNDRDKKELLRAYYAGVSFMDEQVGRVLAAMRERGLAERTLVVFMGDNGYHQWEKNWWGKVTVWELSARVPVIIASPNLPRQNADCHRVVELLDLAPTLVEMVGLPPMPGRDGRSLVPLLRNPMLPWQQWDGVALTEYGPRLRSVRTERWRYCRFGTDEALYDHAADPGETVNQVASTKYRSVVERLRAMLESNVVRLSPQ